jgi:hypothetical protein
MDALVSSFEADPASATPLWRIASSKAASIGDRVYLFKQGAGPRGIFGLGELIEAPREQNDPTDIDAGPTQRARLRLTHLVHPSRGFLLDYESIEDVLPKTLVEAQQSGNGVPDEVERELDSRLALVIAAVSPLTSDDADDPEFDPDSVTDERELAVRAIRVRRGQAEFRAALMAAYGRRCAITGCAVADVLEAAHIFPYLGKVTNRVSNGLLLRADIHTLFDCWLLAIEPTTRKVVVADALGGSSYAKLAGRKLRPSDDLASGPSKRNLERRYAVFKAKNLIGPTASR